MGGRWFDEEIREDPDAPTLAVPLTVDEDAVVEMLKALRLLPRSPFETAVKMDGKEDEEQSEVDDACTVDISDTICLGIFAIS